MSKQKVSKLVPATHPYFHAIRVLRWELDTIEAQMLALWHVRAAHMEAGNEVEPLLLDRLRKLGPQRRRLRAAVDLLGAQT